VSKTEFSIASFGLHMLDYTQSKIYAIVSPNGDKYIGSTTSTLEYRFEGHRISYFKWKDSKGGYTSSFKLFETHGIENCRIELLEAYPCSSKNELELRESELIKSNKCVNSLVPSQLSKGFVRKMRAVDKSYKR